MKALPLRLLALLSLVACGSTAVSVSPAPAPAPAAAAAAAPTGGDAPPIAAVNLPEAPRNWQLLDEATDRVPGVSAERAMRELLAGRQPRRTVLVAIIDNGIDTAHADLKANLWVNAKEVAGNGKDDDANGYADDVRGWNFIGGRDGRDVWHDTFEVTREYARCGGAGNGAAKPALAAGEQQHCDSVAADFRKQRTENEQNLQQHRAIRDALNRALPLLKQALGSDSVTPQRVNALQPSRPEIAQARDIFLRLAANGVTPALLDEAITELESRANYALNPSYDPRPIVGDNYADPTERLYGNADVMGQDAKHGTHVAGIIGAVRGNGIGVDGIAPAVRLMMIRTVPDGDERDKDIANAIRYATDNGANVINMSFGKGYSPYKRVVDDAVKYADAHGILMIHPAGNDGADLDKKANFPTPVYLDGGRPRNWIEVGASSWKGGENLAAPFSNYSHEQVDLFAPGVDILSSIPKNEYERDSGTSMAAPVVTGVAALLMGYYPTLTAADVKRILLASATRHAGQVVTRPGSDSKVPFGSLSQTGGIVNAYNAVKMAEREAVSGKR